MAGTFNLAHFVDAQEPVFGRVLNELRAGAKRSHWMWFIFPQIAGLGSSPMAERYAITSLSEAEAYLRQPVLGPRLETCTALVNAVEGRSAHDIFGSPDDLKFRSCMTLFARVAPSQDAFSAALAKFYGGAPDRATLRLLGE